MDEPKVESLRIGDIIIGTDGVVEATVRWTARWAQRDWALIKIEVTLPNQDYSLSEIQRAALTKAKAALAVLPESGLTNDINKPQKDGD